MAYLDDPIWYVNDQPYPLFYGIVFTATYKEDAVDYVAYDQLRYLKSKDTLVYSGYTTDFIKTCAEYAGLRTGFFYHGAHYIKNRIEENTSYFDMIGNALDQELLHKGNLCVLYDDFGKVTLNNIENMKLDTLLDEETIAEKEETSTIDDRYTTVKLVEENKETGMRKVYERKNNTLFNLYGKLQYFGDVQQGEDGWEKANVLLKLYSQPSRTFTIQKAAGDPRVRAGRSIIINYVTDTGGMYRYSYALVERCTHTFDGENHMMKLELRGGVFSG